MAMQFGEGEDIQVVMDGPYGNAAAAARIGQVTLNASGWKGGESPFSQTVTVDTVSNASKVDLLPDAAQLLALCEGNIALTVKNTGGILTAYAIGGKPRTMTVQVCITEVTSLADSGEIRGNTVGASAPRTDYTVEDPEDPRYLVGREAIQKEDGDSDDYLPRSGGTMTGSLTMGGYRIKSVGAPQADTDAASKGYVDAKHLTATVSVSASGWAGSGPYTQTVTAAVLGTDNPHYTVVYGSSQSVRNQQREAFAAIDLLETQNGSVTLTCFDRKPAADLTLLLEVNR